MLNDTFDDFNFSNLSCNPKPTTREISFDDSIFLNLSELSVLKSNDESLNSEADPNQSIDTDVDIFSDSSVCEPDHLAVNTHSPNRQTEAVNKATEEMHSNLKLSSWGLPAAILEKYRSKNITTMFSWQVDCLNNPKILKEHKNLLYSAPTSGGKTLVAELLSIKAILERHKKVIFILPFVSVVREKMFYFQDILSGSGVRVEGFMGSCNPPGGIKSVQLAVCTIEKANSLINAFLKENTLGEVGAVVIDEMHLLGEPHRGYILELMLTKLKYMGLKDKTLDIQIIGMSATLPNLDVLANWLDACLYVTTFRPIPLYEHAHLNSDLYDAEFKLIREIKPSPDLGTDTDNILQLCLETIVESCSVLIFCPTKNWCENLALQISTAFYRIGSGKGGALAHGLRAQLKPDAITEVLEQFKFCPVGLDEVLRKTVAFGVAFHHAGLTLNERDIIEAAFRAGVVRVLVATSTLSSGVNLPAKRVIIRTPIFHGKPLDALTYRQMIGRAGRMGRDTSGESILLCQKQDVAAAKKLMVNSLQAIESCLEGDGKLHRAILEVIASGVATSTRDVELFTKCTLLSQTDSFEDPIREALEFLVKHEFVKLQDEGYFPTSLGRACLASSIPPEDGLALFTELEKARQCFVLETELHLIYLVTPYSACNQWGNIDWMFYLTLYDKLPSSMKKVAELVGVREGYIVSATRGKLQTNTSKLYHKLLVHKRFFVALALQDLVNEISLGDVCHKFNCNRGMLQSLQQSASTFAGMVTSFSKQLGWSAVEILISQFQDRLQFGVSRDLLDLMRLPILNGRSARVLYDGGIETLIQLANSDVTTIENTLQRVVPFESGKLRDGENTYALKERNKFKNIWITGREGLTEREAAELLVVGARNHLRMELGVKEAHWEEEVETSGITVGEVSDCSLFESTPDVKTNSSRISVSSTGDIIATSQDESFMSLLDKTPNLSRKRTRRCLLLGQTPPKKTKMASINQIEIVDVCASALLFETFASEVSGIEELALAVAYSVRYQNPRVIGLTPSTGPDEELVPNGQILAGFSLFWGQNHTVYYLDVAKIPRCVDLLKKILNDQRAAVRIFESKHQIKLLKKNQVCVNCKVEDPKVGDWLLESDGREKNLKTLTGKYTPHLANLTSMVSPQAKTRASIECYVTWHITKLIKEDLLSELKSCDIYAKEMSCQVVLAQMELTGIGVHKPTLQGLAQTLHLHQSKIEKHAYNLTGRRFSFTSSKDLAKILQVPKTHTKKTFLEKNTNPLATLILQWRKLNSTNTNMVQPLIRAMRNGRINGVCVTHTVTGRVTMHEPNLQNVAKTFEFDGIEVCCRNAFVPKSGYCLLSADYCQLELRLLAHLANDPKLRAVMKRPGDVFKTMAAQWYQIEEVKVTDEMRQHSKKICYGIIYGMRSKSLGEQLNVDENEAASLINTFKDSYPGVKTYLKNVIDECRVKGYVETLAGRRRYLPQINHKNGALKSRSERQAVNTTIQGSAADLVKTTMVELSAKNPTPGANLVLQIHDELLFEVPEHALNWFRPFLKATMEASVNLSIPFPVKIKAGPSWGQLTEL